MTAVDEVWSDFTQAVNMSPKQLEGWTDESGWTASLKNWGHDPLA